MELKVHLANNEIYILLFFLVGYKSWDSYTIGQNSF
jgi:hypothetical protein